MLTSLTSEEHALINKIVSYDIANYDIITATILTVMYSNEFFRPKEDLIYILSLVPSLSNMGILKERVSFLINEGLLKTLLVQDIEICTIIDDLPSKLINIFNDESIKLQFEKSKKRIPFIINHGRLANGKGFINYLNYMSGAQRSIVYPILATHPYTSTIRIIKERASYGIKIRLLFANDDVAQELLGIRSTASLWYNELSQYENVEIRVYSNPSYAALHPCLFVDDRILTLNIYDPKTQRAHDGNMIDLICEPGMSLNVVDWYREKLEQAWNSSTKYGEAKIITFFKKRWLWYSFAILSCCITYIIINNYNKTAQNSIYELISNFLIGLIGYFAGLLLIYVKEKVQKFIRAVIIVIRSIANITRL